MPQPPQRNIFGIDAGLMIAVATIFDTLELGGKIAYPIAAGISAGTSWIPFLNSIIASTVTGAAMAFDVGTTFMFWATAYPTLWLWFAMKRESPFSGEFIGKKIIIGFVCICIGITPILNALPDIIIWTVANIVFAQHQYKDKLMKYNRQMEVIEIDAAVRKEAYREELLSKVA